MYRLTVHILFLYVMTEQDKIIIPVFKNKASDFKKRDFKKRVFTVRRKQSITVCLALATPDLLY